MSESSFGPAPPRTIIGIPPRCALATAVTTSVTPGPAVTAQTPDAGNARVAVGRVTRGLLVAYVDDANPFVETAVVDGLDMAPAKRGRGG